VRDREKERERERERGKERERTRRRVRVEDSEKPIVRGSYMPLGALRHRRALRKGIENRRNVETGRRDDYRGIGGKIKRQKATSPARR
jgi:hypothetical protein